MEVFRLKGTILSPVHITGLTKQNIQRKYQRKILNVKRKFERLVGRRKDIEEYFKKIEEKLNSLMKFAGDWREFIKDGNGNPYIPGSSLKGSFASGIEHYKNWTLNNPLRILAFQNLMFRDAYLKKGDLIKAEIIISRELFLNNVEVLKPGTRFKTEMIYKENNLLKIEEIFVYPMLKTLKIIDLIVKKGKDNLLPNEVTEFYNKYLQKFGSDFSPEKLKEKYKFIKENGLIIRLGKYTGKLSKITLQSFNNEYGNIQTGKGLKYIGRVAQKLLMGFVKIEIE